jgi:hypothetical protein
MPAARIAGYMSVPRTKEAIWYKAKELGLGPGSKSKGGDPGRFSRRSEKWPTDEEFKAEVAAVVAAREAKLAIWQHQIKCGW